MRNRLITPILLVTFIGFTLLGCLSQKSGTAKKGASSMENIIENEILVILKGSVQPSALEKSFKDFGMKVLRQVSKQANIWLFSFDVNKILPNKMLASVKKSVYVKSAQFNHRIELRERDSDKKGNL